MWWQFIKTWEMDWGGGNLCKVHVVCASCLSRFLACFSFVPQHALPLKTASKLFHISVSLFPNEEDTVPSGNLLAYFKCDGASEVSKVIVFLQAQWKINGLVEKGGRLWKIQKCLETIHVKLVGKQALLIPVFMEALLPVMGISVYFTCCFSSFFFFFLFPFLLRGTIEKMLITLTKSQKFKSDLKAQAIHNSPLPCTT